MQEPTDSQLDGLFRKSAEEFNAPFDPVAWQAMKNRLDAHDRLTFWEHLIRWGLPVILILLLSLGSWNANRQQVRAAHSGSSAINVFPSFLGSSGPEPTRPSQRQRRSTPDQLRLSKTGSSEPNDLNKVTVSQPANNEPSVPEVGGSKVLQKSGSDEFIASTVNRSRLPINTGGSANAPHPDKVIGTDANRVVPTIERSRLYGTNLSKAAVARTGRSKPAPNGHATTKSIVAGVNRVERIRSGTKRRVVSRSLPGGNTDNQTAATFLSTVHATTAAKSFSKEKRPSKPTGTGELITNQPPSVNEPVRTENSPESLPAVLSFDELTSRPGHWPKPLAFTGREVTAAPVVVAESAKPLSMKPTPSPKGLSIRLMVSPDLSAIGFRNFQRPGTNLGLLLEYRLAPRWSVQTGVIQSTKVYRASAETYEWPTVVKTKWKVFPQTIDGRCNILDIPINLRYDAAIRPRQNGLAPSRWFVSGGVTTYIMQKEDYTYNYAEADKKHVYPNSYPSMTGWHGPPTGRYNFSQLNLSAGYERALSRRLSWQVEPFMKVPLKGVGYLKIDLLSTGAFFSLRYKL